MKKILRKAEEKDYKEILRLNEADVEMLSPLDERLLARMAELSELFQVAEIDIAPQYNAASMAFHKRMGFTEVGTKPYRESITVSLQIKRMEAQANERV